MPRDSKCGVYGPHKCVGHNYIGHDYMRHNYIGHITMYAITTYTITMYAISICHGIQSAGSTVRTISAVYGRIPRQLTRARI